TGQSGEMSLPAAAASLAPSSTSIAANTHHVLSPRSHTPNRPPSLIQRRRARRTPPSGQRVIESIEFERWGKCLRLTYASALVGRSRQFGLARCALLLRHRLPLSCDTPAHLQARLSPTFSAAAYRIVHAPRDRVTRIGLARASASCAPAARRGRPGREYGSDR
ncbi:hypothetical protein C8F04DRAFT_1089250, partial [Mycena alexandri]